MSRVRDFIAIAMTMGMLGLVTFKLPVPDRLWDVYLMVISFFFGSKGAIDSQVANGSSKVIQSEIKPIVEPLVQPVSKIGV